VQELDLAAAARDLPAAVSWLRVAEGVGSLLDRDASCLVLEVPDFPGWRHSYDAAVGLRKQRLVRHTGRAAARSDAVLLSSDVWQLPLRAVQLRNPACSTFYI
jgi:hypothetical protein